MTAPPLTREEFVAEICELADPVVAKKWWSVTPEHAGYIYDAILARWPTPPSSDPFPPTGLEPRGCPTPGACSCPTPSSEGLEEAALVIAGFQRWRDMTKKFHDEPTDARGTAEFELEQEAWEALSSYKHRAALPWEGIATARREVGE